MSRFRSLCWVLFFLGLPSSLSAQTARQYFDELKSANTFTRYKDIYACFRDDETPSFAVVARVSDVIAEMKKGGDATGAKLLAEAKDGLFVQTYYKGVGSEEYLYDFVKKNLNDDNKEYQLEFKNPMPGKMTYSINWATGRYLLAVYMFQRSRVVPAAQVGGKCELIHPTQSPDK
jgi:hypothetical protein